MKECKCDDGWGLGRDKGKKRCGLMTDVVTTKTKEEKE